jgi:mono/diheme cytochrome c family protein
MPNLPNHATPITRLLGACLMSLAIVSVAACAKGDETRVADSATVSDSAAGNAPARDTTAPAPVDTAVSPPSGDTATRDAAKSAAPGRTPARTTSDTAGRTTPASSTAATTPRPRMRPVARDTAPGMMVPTPEPAPTASETPSPAPAPAAATTSQTQNPAQQAAQQPAQTAGNLSVTQSEYNGWKTFAVNCTRCHGEDAIGSALAPSLVKSLQGAVNHEIYIQTVKNGRPEKGMPAWGGLLNDQQIEEVWQYLKARSDGRLAAGRPRVRSGG